MAGSMFAHRLRRWANIKPTMDEYLALAGIGHRREASSFLSVKPYNAETVLYEPWRPMGVFNLTSSLRRQNLTPIDVTF